MLSVQFGSVIDERQSQTRHMLVKMVMQRQMDLGPDSKFEVSPSTWCACTLKAYAQIAYLKCLSEKNQRKKRKTSFPLLLSVNGP